MTQSTTKTAIKKYIARNPNATMREIAEKVGVSHQTVDYHLRGLVLSGEVAPAKKKRWDVKRE
jgi:predicted transcriptional regulator